MIMCVFLCYPVSIHMSQPLSTGRPISSSLLNLSRYQSNTSYIYSIIMLSHQVADILYLVLRCGCICHSVL